MERQQHVVDLRKIMAIPKRLEIFADHCLQHGADASDAPEARQARHEARADDAAR